MQLLEEDQPQLGTSVGLVLLFGTIFFATVGLRRFLAFCGRVELVGVHACFDQVLGHSVCALLRQMTVVARRPCWQSAWRASPGSQSRGALFRPRVGFGGSGCTKRGHLRSGPIRSVPGRSNRGHRKSRRRPVRFCCTNTQIRPAGLVYVSTRPVCAWLRCCWHHV